MLSSVGWFGILPHMYSIFVSIPGRSTFPRCFRTCPTECSIFKSECSGLPVAVNLVNSSFLYNALTAGDAHSKNCRRSQPACRSSAAVYVEDKATIKERRCHQLQAEARPLARRRWPPPRRGAAVLYPRRDVAVCRSDKVEAAVGWGQGVGDRGSSGGGD